MKIPPEVWNKSREYIRRLRRGEERLQRIDEFLTEAEDFRDWINEWLRENLNPRTEWILKAVADILRSLKPLLLLVRSDVIHDRAYIKENKAEVEKE